MHDRPLKRARVIDLNYLNWNCQNTIACLVSEATFTSDGIVLPGNESLSVKGFARPYDLAVHLYRLGWISRRPANKAYKMAYSAINQSKTALVLMRKNGIDVQIIDSLPVEEMRPHSKLSTSRSDGLWVSQAFHGSRDNVLERTALFAEAFLRNEKDLEHLIEPLKTEKTLPSPPPRMRDDDNDLYSALGGTGEAVYLSDGVWLSSGGGAHDWGR